MSATLLQFAQVNDAAAGTTSKLQKQRILGDFLKNLNQVDLRLAVRYTLGRNHPSAGPKNLNIGWAIVSEALLELLKVEPRAFHAAIVASGEVGEALSRLWPDESREASAPLTLQEIDTAFGRIAKAASQSFKRELTRDLFSGCRHRREATYLAKIIFSDLRTGVQEGVLQAALALAFETPLAEVLRGQLLLGDIEQVALLAKDKSLHTARFQLFHPIAFMLATPVEDSQEASEVLESRSFFAEDKLDGVRAQIHKAGSAATIYTRRMNCADDAFADVIATILRIPGDFLLDGEIVPFCDGCVLPFAHLQRRLHRKVLTPAILRENPAAFIAFDILYLNGELLIDEPLEQRRKRLHGLVDSQAESANLQCTVTVPVSSAADIAAVFEAAKQRRNEGIVLKDPSSKYTPGRRGQAWLKLKTHLPTLDCVVTAAEHGQGKRRSVLSDYTFAVWSHPPGDDSAKLLNIGKAYSGVSDEEIDQLTQLFQERSIAFNGRVHQVRPEIVLEIAFDQVQKSDRHASGYALRFPRIKRIRWDKRPEEADVLARVEQIYNSSANTSMNPAAAAPAPEPTLFDGF